MSYAQVFHCIEPDLRWLLDYAPLIIYLSITPENICIYKMVLKHNSKEKVTFLLSVSKDLSQLNFYTLDSVAGLDSLSKAILGLFSNCCATYTKRIMVTTHFNK